MCETTSAIVMAFTPRACTCPNMCLWALIIIKVEPEVPSDAGVVVGLQGYKERCPVISKHAHHTQVHPCCTRNTCNPIL